MIDYDFVDPAGRPGSAVSSTGVRPA